MYTAKVLNEYGDELLLTGNPAYNILSIEGLTPAKGNISTSSRSNMDGSRVNRKLIEQRNIVITLSINYPIEENRINLYKWFSTKQDIIFYYENNTRAVKIDGVVESFEGSIFENPQTFQISIICPDPYFRDANEVRHEGSYTVSLFEFPFAIDAAGVPISNYEIEDTIVLTNKGDAETGMIISLYARGNVVNPRIYNRENVQFFALDTTLESSDIIEISTLKGEKTVTLIRDGERVNVISDLVDASTWFQLRPGENYFTYEADSGMELLDIAFSFSPIYGGV